MNEIDVIFLDVDGVICLYPEWQHDWSGNQNDRLSELCCRNLKAIIDATNASIVLTSSWRLKDEYLALLTSQLAKFGISTEGMDKTVDLSLDKNIRTHNQLRYAEIKDYLDRNTVKNYIILDDFNLDSYDKEHLVKTKRHEGLTARLRDVCIRKLGKG